MISSMILRIVEGSDNEHRALLSMTHEVKHVTKSEEGQFIIHV